MRAKHVNQGDVGSTFNIHSPQILMPDSAQRFHMVELFLIAFAPALLRID
jgi:hypothetical protein